MSDVSLSNSISNIQRGTYKAVDTASAAAKEAAEKVQEKSQQASNVDSLGSHIDVMA